MLGHDAAFGLDIRDVVGRHVPTHISDHSVILIVRPFGHDIERGLVNGLHVCFHVGGVGAT